MATPTWFGFNFPFYTPPSTVMPPQTDARLIKNDLLQLLLTSPGERRMRPSFGTPIRKFPFEPLSDDDVSDLRRNITKAIQKFEKRVILKAINISSNADNNSIAINVLVALTRDPNIELSVDLVTVSPEAIVPTQQRIV